MGGMMIGLRGEFEQLHGITFGHVLKLIVLAFKLTRSINRSWWRDTDKHALERSNQFGARSFASASSVAPKAG